jgi:hypothetical protein
MQAGNSGDFRTRKFGPSHQLYYVLPLAGPEVCQGFLQGFYLTRDSREFFQDQFR